MEPQMPVGIWYMVTVVASPMRGGGGGQQTYLMYLEVTV